MGKLKENMAILLFYGAYGLFYLIALLYREFLPSFTFEFWIAEKGQNAQFTMDLAEIADILLLGILFSINVFRAFLLLQRKHSNDAKINGRFSFLIGVIILNLGVVIHMVTNQLNNLVSQILIPIDSDPNLTFLALGLYFWDELASHFLIGIGFFLLVLCFLYIEKKNPEIDEKLTGWQIKLICATVGAGIALGYVEGQVGIPFFIVCLIIMPFVFLKRKKKPFHYATFLVCLGYVAFILIYGLATYLTVGIKDYYPFLYQLGELMV